MMTLDKVANVVTIIAGLAVSGALAARSLTPVGPPDPRPKFEVGERLGDEANIAYSRKAFTLVVAVDPTCAICTRNMPFFKQLIHESRDSATAVVVVGKDSVETLKKYLAANDIDGIDIVSVPLRSLRVTAIPTMLLADNQGRFANAWVGGLPHSKQEELLTQMRNGWK